LRIGFSFDYGGLINNRTIADNMLLPLVYHKLISESEARARVDGMIDRFDLKKYKHERPAHVPGRVRKLAVLLRALVSQPQLLLLDDPSVGLGESTQVIFAQTIQEMRTSGSLRHVFISSYDDHFMSLLPHEIIHLDGGLLYHQANGPDKEAVNV
jgi:ABC-type transporter Mla maintaining outer membrane lipid asymmetry ATPase subunit MlaF